MNQTNLQTLYHWLWPFQPDKRDYDSDSEDVIYNFTSSIDAVRGGMPNIFWEMLQSGHSRTAVETNNCLLYTSPSPRDRTRSRMPSSA